MTCRGVFSIVCASTFIVGAVLALNEGAIAQQTKQLQTVGQGKSISWEQAWTSCVKYIDSVNPKSANENDAQRVAQFKACMAKFGVRE